MTKPNPQFLTPSQVARREGCGVNWIQKLCSRGRIAGAFQVGDGPTAAWIIPVDYVISRVPLGNPNFGRQK